MGDLKKIILHKSFYNWILTQLKLILILEDYNLFNIYFSSQHSTFILSFVLHIIFMKEESTMTLNLKCSLYGNSIG